MASTSGVHSLDDLFASTYHLRAALLTEPHVIEELFYFGLLEEARLSQTKDKFAANFGPFHPDRQGRDVGAIPAYLMTVRIVDYQHRVAGRSLADTRKSLDAIFKRSVPRSWPTAGVDLSGAAVGICRLQQTYGLTTRQIAAMRSPLLPALAADDFKEVARGCYPSGPFGNTSAWVRVSLEEAVGAQSRYTTGLASLLEGDRRCQRHDACRSRRIPFNCVPSYRGNCTATGDVRPASSARGRLVCKVTTNGGHPLLLLRPLKMEILSLEPRVVLMPDFLTRSECEDVRKAGAPRLKRGMIFVKATRGTQPSIKRVGKTSWVDDSECPALERATRRLAAATGLSLEYAEAYQLSNYGVGGQYTAHTDFYMPGDPFHRPGDGNRLATALIYLSDVEAGGATAFVRLGVAVAPRAGSALFWYNWRPSSAPVVHSGVWLDQMRAGDPATRHAACPVLIGSKWIVTKWIRERNNVAVNYDVPS
ncbi:prolyl 4-hydroxylase subunit alpha-2-like [Haemaphysalis longicornis]